MTCTVLVHVSSVATHVAVDTVARVQLGTVEMGSAVVTWEHVILIMEDVV